MNAWFVVRRRRVATGNCRMDGLANAFGIGDVRNSYWFDIAMEPLVYRPRRRNDDFAFLRYRCRRIVLLVFEN
jgi:hypothetical protein